jgi:hypothetical protein
VAGQEYLPCPPLPHSFPLLSHTFNSFTHFHTLGFRMVEQGVRQGRCACPALPCSFPSFPLLSISFLRLRFESRGTERESRGQGKGVASLPKQCPCYHLCPSRGLPLLSFPLSPLLSIPFIRRSEPLPKLPLFAPYLASAPPLMAGGYQKYPPALRKGTEAKYGAKKGISDGRAGGKSGEGDCRQRYSTGTAPLFRRSAPAITKFAQV